MIARGEDDIDGVAFDMVGKAAMQRDGLSPELQHVAEHGDAAADVADPRRAKQIERRLHGSGIGVVAFIDQRDLTFGNTQIFATTTARGCFDVSKRRRGALKINAGSMSGQQHRQRVQRKVFSRYAELVGEIAIQYARMDARGVFAEFQAGEPRFRVGMLTKAQDASDGTFMRSLAQTFELSIITVEDGNAILNQPGENLRLCVGDPLDRFEIF